MGIKSTSYINRSEAIDRIKEIASLINRRNYRELEQRSNEHDYDVRKFVDKGVDFDVEELDNWTNDMLGDQMDVAYYRYSMFDNYIVRDDEATEKDWNSW